MAEWWKVAEVRNVGERSPYHAEVTGQTRGATSPIHSPGETSWGETFERSQTRPTDSTTYFKNFASKDSGTRLSAAAEMAQANTDDLYAVGELIAFGKIEANRQQMIEQQQGLTEVFRGIPKASVPAEARQPNIETPKIPVVPVTAPRETVMDELFVDSRQGRLPASKVYSPAVYESAVTPARKVYDPIDQLSNFVRPSEEIAVQETKTEQAQKILLDQGVQVGWGRGEEEGHRANDYFAPQGTPMISLIDGEVIEVNYNTGDSMGSFIKVWNNNTHTVDLYGHMENAYVQVGDRVTAGQPIAEFGRIGNVETTLPTTGVIHHERYQTPGTFTPSGSETYYRAWENQPDLGWYRTSPPAQEAIAELMRQYYGAEAINW